LSVQDRLHHPGHRRLFANSLFVGLGQGSVALLFLIYLLAARVLGEAAFGQFSLGMSVALVLLALPAWGTARYASILAARDPERTADVLAPSVGLMALLALIYLPAVGISAALIADNEIVTWVALVSGVDFLAREHGQLLRFLMRVHGAFAADTISVFAERGLMVLASIGVLLLAPDPVLLAAAFAGGRTLGVLVTGALYRSRVGPLRVRFDAPSLMRIFSGGTPIAIRRGLADLTFRLDMLFLGAVRGPSEVGWYGSVQRLMDGVVMVPNVVTESFAPTLSANFAQGRRDVIQRLYQRGAKYLLLGGLFLAAVFVVLPDPLIRMLFGEDYAPAADALPLLAPAVVFVFLRRMATEVLDNVDLRSTTAWAFAAGLAASVAANALLVPRYGYLGAAAATSLSQGTLMGVLVWSAFRAGHAPLRWRHVGCAVVSVGLAAAVMRTLVGVPILALAAAGATYLISLTLLRVWDEKDLGLARDLFRRVART
jgi:O-antigen/teichoic acid export membrane protein